MPLLLLATPLLPLLPEHLEVRCVEAWGVAPLAVPPTVSLAHAPVAHDLVKLQGRLDAALAEAIRSAAKPPTTDIDPQVPCSPLLRMQRAWEDAHAAGDEGGSVGEGVSCELVLRALRELQQAPSPSELSACGGVAAPAAGSAVAGMDATRARATLRAHCEAQLVLKPAALLKHACFRGDAQESRGQNCREGQEGGFGETGRAEGSGAPVVRPADVAHELRLRQLRSLVMQVELRLEIASTPAEIAGATEPLSGGEYRELKKLLTMYANLASSSDDGHGLVRYVGSVLAAQYGARLPLTIGRLRADFDVHEAGGETGGGEAGSGEAGGGDRGGEGAVHAHDVDGAGGAAPIASLLRPAPRRESSGGGTAGGGGVPLSSLPGFGAPGGLMRDASSLSACLPPPSLLRRQSSCVSLDRQSSIGGGGALAAAQTAFRIVTLPCKPRAKRGAAAGAKPAGEHNRNAASKASGKAAMKEAAHPGRAHGHAPSHRPLQRGQPKLPGREGAVNGSQGGGSAQGRTAPALAGAARAHMLSSPAAAGSKRAARKAAALCSPAPTREVFVSETPTRPTTRAGSDSGSNPGSARRATRSAVLVLESPLLPSRAAAYFSRGDHV